MKNARRDLSKLTDFGIKNKIFLYQNIGLDFLNQKNIKSILCYISFNSCLVKVRN